MECFLRWVKHVVTGEFLTIGFDSNEEDAATAGVFKHAIAQRLRASVDWIFENTFATAGVVLNLEGDGTARVVDEQLIFDGIMRGNSLHHVIAVQERPLKIKALR